jgi:DNA polymerase III delta prime subunit
MKEFKPTLPVPAQWLDEYCRNQRPDLYHGAVNDVGNIVLSWSPKGRQQEFLDGERSTIDHVAHDLSAGFAMHRRPDRQGEGHIYTLRGSRYQVLVCEAYGQNTSVALAKVIAISRVDREHLAPRDIVTRVTFSPIWEEDYCDIKEVWRKLKTLRKRQHQRDRLEAEAPDVLSTPKRQKTVEQERRLHAELRYKYGCLKQTLRLLKQRANTEQAAEAMGQILPSKDEGDPEGKAVTTSRNVTSVQIKTLEGVFEEGDRVAISKGDSNPSATTKLTHTGKTRLEFGEQDRVELSPGDEVTIRKLARFAMWAHDQALDAVLTGDVSGQWDDLVTLLCDPAKLSAVSAEPPPFYYADRDHEEDPESCNPLNEAQRKAVSGALSSPHAFFIQGPPGTGKTTVITELVRQLTARDERVLLLAPSHVAVDEVLVRIARKQDHVLPVRLSWDDQKITRKEAQNFAEERVRRQLARGIRTPATAMSPEWDQAHRSASKVVSAVDAWHAAVDATAGTVANANAHDATLVKMRQDAEYDLTELRSNTAEQENLAEQARSTLAALDSQQPAIEQQLATARAGAGWIKKVLGTIGTGEIGKYKRQLAKNRRDARRAEQTRAGAQQALTELGASLVSAEEHWPRAIAEQEAKTAEAHAGTEAALDAEEKALDAALVASGADSSGELDNLRAKSVAEAERLRKLMKMEARWFSITGQDGGEDDSALSIAEAIGNELLQSVNLVCCTTTGIASRQFVEGVTFDTLIIDEASRVTDSEFLIGAVRAKRWILVGDEHQLPPYVEQDDEFHLHALASLYARDNQGGTLEEHVKRLGDMWREDEELHQFREHSVLETAGRIDGNGSWDSTYESTFSVAASHFESGDNDAEQQLLATMRTYLVRSLLERCVAPEAKVSPLLKQRLKIQRRMIEPIAQLVSDPVYAGDYVSPDRADLARCGITPLVLPVLRKPIVFMDTSKRGDSAAEVVLDPSGAMVSRQTARLLQQLGAKRGEIGRSGFVNPLEALWIVQVCQELDRQTAREGCSLSVSILCFYRAQSRLIENAIRRGRGFERLDFRVIDAIDKIQGQESDMVFISFCRAQPGRRGFGPAFGRWLKDYRRLNVAATRAHRSLVMVGHVATLEKLSFSDEESKAEAFYRNLWALVDPHNKGDEHPAMGTIHDFKTGMETSR